MTDDLRMDRLGPWLKGFPATQAPIDLASVARLGWNLLAGDLPLPLAVLKRDALAHNLAWMQAYARSQGVDLAPHGKTTMSPELFRRQLDAGAWGITFATVFQLRVGVAAGVRRALIANQVHQAADLAALAQLRARHADLRVVFLVDSLAQLALIEEWHAAQDGVAPFEVLLEVGVPNGRTGVRDHDAALRLARGLHASATVRLAGIECYEGLSATGDSARDEPFAAELMQRLARVAAACDAENLFETGEVLVSAGGSGIFDLVAARLRLDLRRPVRGLLRSGCYVTHDHGRYMRLVAEVNRRCGCGDGLQPALEVWTSVQSTPEPGLAILTAGRRDLGFDTGLPTPIAHAPSGAQQAVAPAAGWAITALNDQHAYLRFEPGAAVSPEVGDRIGLGISHPCTTFDKWHWMPVVDDRYNFVDAVTIHF
jgi:D-serine dehydratase